MIKIWNSVSFVLVLALLVLLVPAAALLGPLQNITLAQGNYTLNMSVTGTGTTDPSVGDHSYEEDTNVTLTAYPDLGWGFVSWSIENQTLGVSVFSETFPNTTGTWDGSNQDNSWTVSKTSSSNIQIGDIASAAEPPHLHFQNCNGDWGNDWAYTSIDLSGYTNVDIEYLVRINGNDNTGEGIRSEYSPDGGSTWYTMYEHVDNDIAWQLDHFDLPDAHATANFVLRFNAAGSAAGDYSFIDTVTVTGDKGTQWTTTNNPTNVIMNANTTATANFIPSAETYNLTISSTTGGSVTIPGEGTFIHYAQGVVVNLVAQVDSGYRFTGWTGDVATIADVYARSTNITMNGNYSITANFEQGTYTLTMAVGTGSGTTTPAVGVHAYDPATNVSITAYPGGGCAFVNWTIENVTPGVTIFSETFPVEDTSWDGTGQDNLWNVSGTYTRVWDDGVAGAADPPNLFFAEGGTAASSIDLSGNTGVSIEYLVSINGNEAGEGVKSEYSPDGGTTWYTMYTHTGANIAWQLDHFDLSDDNATANFLLRFNSTGSDTGDRSYIDNVTVTCDKHSYWNDTNNPTYVIMNSDITATANFFGPGVTVTPTSGLVTTESGGNDTYTLVLDVAPNASVTIDLSSDDTSEGTVSPSSVVFGVGNWSTPQTVTVTGANDDLLDGNITYNAVNANTSSTDPNYDDLAVDNVGVTNVDDDVYCLTMAVDGTGTTDPVVGDYGYPPDENVTIEAYPGGGCSFVNWTIENVTPGVLAFSETFPVEDTSWDGTGQDNLWNVSGTNTRVWDDGIAGADDPPNLFFAQGGTAASSIDLSGNTSVSIEYLVSINGNEAGEGVKSEFSPDNGSTWYTMYEHTGANIAWQLDHFDLSDDNATANFLLRFNSTGDDTGDRSYIDNVTVTGDKHSYWNDTDNPTYVIMNANKTATANFAGPGVTVTPTSGLVTNESGGTDNYTLVLDALPTASVTIDITSDDTGEGTVSPSNVVFGAGNWSTPQTITVTGVDDTLLDGNIAYNAVNANTSSSDPNYDDLAVDNVGVTNVDDDFYRLNMLVGTGNGTTTPAVGDHWYPPDENVTLTAYPDGGWGFVNWTITNETLNNTALSETFPNANSAWDGSNQDNPWTVETSPADNIYIQSTGPNPPCLRFSNCDEDWGGDWVYTNIDLSGYSNVDIDYNWSEGTIGAAEGFRSEYSPNNGSSWVIMHTNLNGPHSWQWDHYDLPDVNATANFVLRFNARCSAPGDDIYIDNVTVTGDLGTQWTTTDNPTYVIMNALTNATANFNETGVPTPGITVTPTSGLVTTEGGGTDNFTIVLDSEPTNSVSIGLTSDDLSEGTVSPASVTLGVGNWSTPQTVTVTGQNDDIDDGNIAYNIVTAAATSSDGNYNTMDADDVVVTNMDNDTAGITVTPTSGLVTTEGGGTDNFTIVLDSEPTASVTIDISSNDTTEGNVSPASVVFGAGNWSTPKLVTVTGGDDAVADGDIVYLIIVGPVSSTDGNYSAIDPDDVTVTNMDDDVATATLNVDINENVTSERRGGNVTVDGTPLTPPYPRSVLFGSSPHTFSVMATPDAGYIFVNWTGNVNNPTAQSTTITVAGSENVTANFYEKDAEVGVSTNVLDFGSLFVDGANPAPQNVTITNIGGKQLNWNSVLTYDGGNPNATAWCTRNPTNGGPLDADETQDTQVSVDIAGITETGSYIAYLDIGGGGTESVNVIFTLLPSGAIAPVRNIVQETCFAGDTVDIWVNWTASNDNFNSIGLTDNTSVTKGVSSFNWPVTGADVAWCTPNADSSAISGAGNTQIEYGWAGSYSSGKNFNARYQLTVPGGTATGTYDLVLDDNTTALVAYYIGATPWDAAVTGEFQITVIAGLPLNGTVWEVIYNWWPGDMKVNGATVDLVPPGNVSPILTTFTNATGVYLFPAVLPGNYTLRAGKAGFTTETLGWVNVTGLEASLADRDFIGVTGLEPTTCTKSYAQRAVNCWLYPPTPQPNAVLDAAHVVSVVNVWLAT